jgi:hypothetical protein
MGATSNEAKRRWNEAHYTQVKVSVPPETAAAFKAKCMADGVSMASEISRFMNGGTQGDHPLTPFADPYATRQKRRKALSALTGQLETLHSAEQQYLDNIPANLQNSRMYEAAEQTVTALEEALSILSEAY